MCPAVLLPRSADLSRSVQHQTQIIDRRLRFSSRLYLHLMVSMQILFLSSLLSPLISAPSPFYLPLLSVLSSCHCALLFHKFYSRFKLQIFLAIEKIMNKLQVGQMKVISKPDAINPLEIFQYNLSILQNIHVSTLSLPT